MANFVDYFIPKFCFVEHFLIIFIISILIGIIRKTLEFLLKTEHLFLYNIENECSFLMVSLDRLRVAAK